MGDGKVERCKYCNGTIAADGTKCTVCGNEVGAEPKDVFNATTPKETNTNAKTSSTGVAVTGGTIGGAIGGALIVWGSGQYMSWGTFAVFLFTMMGVDKDKKWLAGIIFAAVAGLMAGILK